MHTNKTKHKKAITNKLCTHSLPNKFYIYFIDVEMTINNSILIRSQITHNAHMLRFHNLLRKCNFSHKSLKYLC